MALSKRLFLTAAAAVVASGIALGSDAHAATEDNVITLTQTGCQFLEPEGTDHGYTTKRKADCLKINKQSGDERLAQSEIKRVKAGTYTFRVSNTNVPYELGFWIRESDYDWRNPLHKATKVSVSGGGLFKGKSKDYVVELTPGEYVYSCPLNPTPNYKLIVE